MLTLFLIISLLLVIMALPLLLYGAIWLTTAIAMFVYWLADFIFNDPASHVCTAIILFLIIVVACLAVAL